MLLILTMIACVEKLDEKEDIITACVTTAVYNSLVTIITPGSLMVTGHCMCGSNLRLRRTDQAPMIRDSGLVRAKPGPPRPDNPRLSLVSQLPPADLIGQ